MFNDFDAVNSVEWLPGYKVFKLTQAELKILHLIRAGRVRYCRGIAIHAYHLASMERQELTDRSRPASCIKNTVLLPGHCNPLYQSELCFVPETLGSPIGLQGTSLIITANAYRVAFPPF